MTPMITILHDVATNKSITLEISKSSYMNSHGYAYQYSSLNRYRCDAIRFYAIQCHHKTHSRRTIKAETKNKRRTTHEDQHQTSSSTPTSIYLKHNHPWIIPATALPTSLRSNTITNRTERGCDQHENVAWKVKFSRVFKPSRIERTSAVMWTVNLILTSLVYMLCDAPCDATFSRRLSLRCSPIRCPVRRLSEWFVKNFILALSERPRCYTYTCYWQMHHSRHPKSTVYRSIVFKE